MTFDFSEGRDLWSRVWIGICKIFKISICYKNHKTYFFQYFELINAFPEWWPIDVRCAINESKDTYHLLLLFFEKNFHDSHVIYIFHYTVPYTSRGWVKNKIFRAIETAFPEMMLTLSDTLFTLIFL